MPEVTEPSLTSRGYGQLLEVTETRLPSRGVRSAAGGYRAGGTVSCRKLSSRGYRAEGHGQPPKVTEPTGWLVNFLQPLTYCQGLPSRGHGQLPEVTKLRLSLIHI